MNKLPILNDQEVFENLQKQTNPYFKEYYAYYSSWYGGITQNPSLMLLPLDDHIVHRGDGIFEAIKVSGASVYLLDEHLQRLFQSAEKIGLKIPHSFAEVKEIILQTLRVAGKTDALIRLYISRGPGNFGVNPYDSIKPQVYVVITKLTEPAIEKFTQGVRVGLSKIPAKPPLFAQAKTCNYLVNVLMKKEAVEQELDFVIGMDEKGFITESATENIIIIDKQGVINYPTLESILRGTIMMRICELAREAGITVKERAFSATELQAAREAFITGTTQNVLPVVEFDGRPIGNGQPGHITLQLQALIAEDIRNKTRGTQYLEVL